MGIWLEETGTAITVGGPSKKGPLGMAFETRKHTQARVFQVKSKEHLLSQGHGKLGHLPAEDSG